MIILKKNERQHGKKRESKREKPHLAPGMVGHACDPSTQKTETGRLRV
jgi:hypothetical protein